jgi:hypothetical protein
MKKVFLTVFLLYNCFVSAQVSIKDSTISTPMIGLSYGYHLAAGDLLSRFGNSSSVQLNVDFKNRANILVGINGSYIFGKEVKEDMFANISTPEGYIINSEGTISDVRLWERGFTVSGTLGGLLHFKKPNPNSGLLFNMGFGFIQHKIRIEVIGNDVPQLSKEYKKGYDRLTNGFLLTENLGYLYLSNNRLTNLYIGLECLQGFTQNRRSYNYDTMEHDSKKRIDILYGARLMWILPLYKKPPQEYYTH